MILPILLALFQAPSYSVTPSAAQATSGDVHGPFSYSKVYTIHNSSPNSVNWSASADVDWLSISPASGTVPTNSTRTSTVTVDSDAEDLPVGVYDGTVTYVVGGQSFARVTTLTVKIGSLEVGGGWGGATSEPGQVGSGTAKCIARWDVVPYQTIDGDTFTVGIVAFHIAGIDRVEIACEDGDWLPVTDMALNAQTGVWEYSATLHRADFAADGPIELRAIAYPKSAAPQADGTDSYPGGGYPRLLDSLFLYVDVGSLQTALTKYVATTGNDSTGDGTSGNPYATIATAEADLLFNAGSGDNATIQCAAGNYTLDMNRGSDLSVPDRWLTITGSGVTINANASGLNYGYTRAHHVRLLGLTVNVDIEGDAAGDSLWLDTCTFVGAGQGTDVSGGTGWAHNFIHRYWTDCSVSDDRYGPGNADLIRDATVERIGEAPFNQPECVVNCTVDDVDAGSMTGTWHPDVLVWNPNDSSTIENGVAYGVSITDILAQGVFIKDAGLVKNLAFVNVVVQRQSSAFTSAIEDTVEHVLFYHCSFVDQPLRLELGSGETATLLSARGCLFEQLDHLGTDWTDGWFDENHISGGSYQYGTSYTTGDPVLDGSFAPDTGSPLLSRQSPLLVPVDLNGTARAAPCSVGAIE